jgi:hypothetical protein
MARLELEIVVFFVHLRPPAFARGRHPGVIILDRTLQEVFHALKEVVVWPGFDVNPSLEILWSEQVATDGINRYKGWSSLLMDAMAAMGILFPDSSTGMSPLISPLRIESTT